jgi:hypothetical protein
MQPTPDQSAPVVPPLQTSTLSRLLPLISLVALVAGGLLTFALIRELFTFHAGPSQGWAPFGQSHGYGDISGEGVGQGGNQNYIMTRHLGVPPTFPERPAPVKQLPPRKNGEVF